MRRAMDLAHQGRFTVSPNPRVGCVIARYSDTDPTQSPVILGEGYHQRKGELHAERVALAACTDDPRGAVMAVTLEPCCHHGATPPCTEAILEAGIRRVIVATEDPFPQVKGQGIDLLRQHGAIVDVGLMRDEARYENRFFFHYHERGLPCVVLKAAMSLDGKLATAQGDSKWITGETAREHVHRIRGEMDAILIGVGTVLSDDPTLTARIADPLPCGIHQPIRIVLDPMLTTPTDSNLLKTLDESPVWFFCCSQVSNSAIDDMKNRGGRVSKVSGDDKRLDLQEVLTELANDNRLSVMVEGGPRVHTSFLENGWVNELFVYIAPVVVGGKDAPGFYMGQGADTILEAKRLESVQRVELGPDMLIHGIFRGHGIVGG